MARLRTIKPGFYTNDLLAEVSPLGRILFSGLWCIADRAGRLEDRPKRIKAEVLPYDDCDVDGLLNDLAERGFVLRYQVGQARYIAVVNWGKHQTPHIKEAESTIPAPPQNDTETVQVSDKHGTSTVQAPCEDDASTPCICLGIGNLEPETPLPPTGDDRREESPAASTYSSAFEQFWERYPRHTDKKQAYAVWQRIRPSPALIETIIVAIEHQKRGRQWQQGVIPHPTTWLRRSRWEDEIEPQPAPITALPRFPSQADLNRGGTGKVVL